MPWFARRRDLLMSINLHQMGIKGGGGERVFKGNRESLRCADLVAPFKLQSTIPQ
jgi:hypothetical protein